MTAPYTPQTFSQMQQQGYARPSWQMTRPWTPDGTQATQTTAQVSGGQPGPYTMVSLGQAMTSAGGQMQQRTWQYTPSGMPQQPQGGLNDQYLWQQYQQYQPFQPFQYNQQQTQLPQGYQGGQFNAQTGGFTQVPQSFQFGPFDYPQQQQRAPGATIQMPQFGQYQNVQGPQAGGIPQYAGQYNPQQMASAGNVGRFNAGAYGAPGGLDESARYQTVGGPELRQMGGFNAQGTPFQGQLEQALGAAIGNPSAYNSENILSQFDVLNRRMGQGFDVERQRINEEMARRGLYSSTVAGGRLGDLATNQAQAQSDLATNLMNQSAARYQQDRSSAIAQAMGYGGLQFGNQLAGYQANLAGSNQNFQQDLAARAFQGDQNALAALNAMQRGQFGLQQQGQAFGQGLSGFQANLGAQGQQFGQNLSGAQFAGDEQQRQLNNMLQSAMFGRESQAQQFGQGLQGAQFQAQQGQFGAQNQLQQQQLAGQLQQALFGQQMQGAQFGQSEAARMFGQGLQGYQTNLGTQQQQFQNAMQQAGMQQQLGQQGYQNQLQNFLTNQGVQQQGFENQAVTAQMANQGNQQAFQNQLAGYGANLGGQQQGFNQQQQLLQNLMGYGQQQFENRLGYENLLSNADIWQQIAPLLGLYGGA